MNVLYHKAHTFVMKVGPLLGTLALVGLICTWVTIILCTQGVSLASVADVIAALAAFVVAVLGIIAFRWGLADWRKGYLHIGLSIEATQAGFVLIKTTIENKGGSSRISRRQIGQALLLVHPEDEDPIEAYNNVAVSQKPPLKKIKLTNDIDCCSDPETAAIRAPMFDGDKKRAIIRLPFYYSENVRIADESISYTVALKKQDFPAMRVWSVRFFVFPKPPTEQLHRSTQAAFVFSN